LKNSILAACVGTFCVLLPAESFTDSCACSRASPSLVFIHSFIHSFGHVFRTRPPRRARRCLVGVCVCALRARCPGPCYSPVESRLVCALVGCAGCVLCAPPAGLFARFFLSTRYPVRCNIPFLLVRFYSRQVNLPLLLWRVHWTEDHTAPVTRDASILY
jgi:hypothetical protein